MPEDVTARALGPGARARTVAAETARAMERLHAIHDPSPTVTAAPGHIATGAPTRFLLEVEQESGQGTSS